MNIEYWRTGKYYLQFRMIIVHQFQFFRPIFVAVYFINKQMLSSLFYKKVRQIQQTMFNEIKVFGCYIQGIFARQILL